MLSRMCDGCRFHEHKQCRQRYVNARKGEFCYCPDGSKLLIDEEW